MQGIITTRPCCIYVMYKIKQNDRFIYNIIIFWVIRRKSYQKKVGVFFYFRLDREQDPDPDPFYMKQIRGSGSVLHETDPFYHETDPRIRIKMKRIRNTAISYCRGEAPKNNTVYRSTINLKSLVDLFKFPAY